MGGAVDLLPAVGAACCGLALLPFGWLSWKTVPRALLLLHGNRRLAKDLGLTVAGRDRNDAPVWFVGTHQGRPVALGVVSMYVEQARIPLSHTRHRRKTALRIVTGCRSSAHAWVWTPLLGNRVVYAEGVDPSPLTALVEPHGWGVSPRGQADPKQRPGGDFAADWPAICWVDASEPDVDRVTAERMLERLSALADSLERT